MGITKDSTLSQVFEESKKSFTPTSSDVGEWTKLTPATGDAVFTTKVGLLGVDLTDFLANCAEATKRCHVPDYDNLPAGLSVSSGQQPQLLLQLI